MKRCVLTIAIGDDYKKIALLTHPSIKEYASKINADFISVEQCNTSTPHWEKLVQIYHLLNQYERIIYVDTDLIIRDDCPDLFDIVPENQLGAFDEMPFTPRRESSLINACKDYNLVLNDWNGKYYNTGVMVISRQQKQLFKKPKIEIPNFFEQGYLNAKIAQAEEASEEDYVHGISYKFNRMTCMDKITGEERHDSYIIHYAGFPSIEFVLGIIAKDIKKWEDTRPEYKFQQHILVNVAGGLGDQLCAEPSIRFMKERIYPEADIKILTHHPILFRHLGLPVFKYGEFKGEIDVPYYTVNSLPGPDTIMWKCVSHLLSHSVDFSAMALLGRILPNADKQIKLQVSLDDLSEVIDAIGITDLSQLVLVHAGRHWESKTFPASWWQELIDGLQREGIKVCLIGADNGKVGVVDLIAREGMIDTRNLLSINGLIALVAAAKTLISNDSAPIHIAGAFDNNIILIPTCKHPDHILPYRNGSQYYKAVALYKKLMAYEYNSQPTLINGSAADKLVGDFKDYLPEPDAVVNQVLNME